MCDSGFFYSILPHEEGFRTMISGESMLPSLSQGTWVWVKPVKTFQRKLLRLRLGDIILFFMKDHEEFVCHRVIRYNRQWIWEASEYFGTHSRILRSQVAGKIYALESCDGQKHIVSAYSRFAGLYRCYRNLITHYFRYWLRRSITG